MIKYARAGGGNWTADATWSTTSGGAADTVAPTAADDVVLDASSGNVTINAASVCRSINCTGYTGTLTHNATFTLSIGDATAGASNIALKFVSGMTYTLGNAATSAIAFISTSATQQTVDFAGKTTGDVTYGATGSPSYQMTGNHVQGASATVTLTIGTLDTNGMTCTWGKFASSNSNTRTLTLGASPITLLLTSGTGWNMTTNTGLTVNCGTSVITLNGVIFVGGAKTYNEVKFVSAMGSASSTNTFAILRVLLSGSYGGLQLFNNQTVTGTFEATGSNVSSQRVFIRSDTPGTQRTLTCNGTCSITNADFVDINAAGSATWSGTSVGNCGNNANITFTTPVTRYWVGNNGNYHATTNWSTSSGGSSGASMPLPQDTAIFDANSFSTSGRVVDVQDQLRVGDISFVGATNSPSFGHGTFTINYYGSVTLISAMTMSSHATIAGRGTHTLTMNGQTLGTNLFAVQAGAGSWTFADDFVTGSSINYYSGTFTVLRNITCTGVFFNGSFTRTINMGNWTWTLTGTGPWSGSSFGNVTINSQGSTIKITDSSATDKNFGFSGGAFTYNVLWIATGSTGKVILLRGDTFKEIRVNAGRFLRLTTGTTTTITNLVAKGSSGNVITIDATTAGTPATISKPSGVVDDDWLSLKDITATGGATFYAGANSTNVSGNTGWTFSAAPATPKREFMAFFA